jgi:site-specific recombinase XerD
MGLCDKRQGGIKVNYLKNFEMFLNTDKYASPSTVSGYLTDIKQFLNYEGTPEDLSKVTPTHIRSFIAHLTKKGRKRGTINRAVCSLKVFFDYLTKEEKLFTKSPSASIKTMKKEKSLPKYLSEADVQSILKVAAQSSLKDRLIIELLYGSGGRVSEVASLKVEDIDFEESFISLLGKGNKERNNPIHENCIELIKLYMNANGIKSGYLFPHRDDPSQHMTREGVYRLVKRLAVKAGIDSSKVSPHVFRHSFATHMLEHGCDMAHVQELLGHEDIATTKIYARITKSNKKATYAKFHPLASTVL